MSRTYGPFLPSKMRRRAGGNVETQCRRGRGIQTGNPPAFSSFLPTLEVQRVQVAASPKRGLMGGALAVLAALGFTRWQRRTA